MRNTVHLIYGGFASLADPTINAARTKLASRWPSGQLGRVGGFNTTIARLLDGRAFHRAIGTEDAAVACLWPKQHVAARAFVEIEAGVGGHGFGCNEATLRTSEGGLENRRWMHFLVSNEGKTLAERWPPKE